MRPANSVTNNTRLKLQINYGVIHGIIIKTTLERVLYTETLIYILYKHFQTEGYKIFLNKTSATLIGKTDGKDPKKGERYWMRTLKTMESCGPNIADSV